MDVNLMVAVSLVALATLTLRGAGGNYTFQIETILASSCHADTKCENTPREINFTANQHGLNVTLLVSWFNPSNIFQLYSYSPHFGENRPDPPPLNKHVVMTTKKGFLKSHEIERWCRYHSLAVNHSITCNLSVRSAGRRHANLVLIDEHLTRLSSLPPPSSDCQYVILPETFWLYQEQPEPETDDDDDDDCCEGFLTLEAFEEEPPEVDISKCVGWWDPAQGLVAVLRHLQWQNVIVMYDAMNEQQAADVIASFDSCRFVLNLIESKNNLPTDPGSTVSMSNLNHYTESKYHQQGDELEIRNLLRAIHDNTSADDNIHIVVLCNLINIKRIMSVANIFDLERNRNSALNFRSRWLIALPTDRTAGDELTDFLEDINYLDNVAVVDSRYTQHKQDQAKISNKVEELLKEFMIRVAEVKNRNSFLELTNAIIQILQSKTTPCTDTQINSLYFGGMKGRYLNTVAMVNNSRGVVLRGSNDVFPNTLFALNNRTLKISTVQWFPFVNLSTNGYEGLCMDMLKQLELVMNFTAEIGEPKDGDWGKPVRNDSTMFTGLVGQLQRQEVDMVVAPLAMNEERDNIIDFALPFFTDYTTVVFKRQDPNSSKWLTLIRPFKWQVHLTIWISMISVAILITVLERQNPYYQAKSQKSAFNNFIDSICYLFGTLLTQGGEDLPTSTTGLTLVSFWLMFSVIVASTYSGNLIAFLTVNLDTLPFDSLQTMLDQDGYKYGTIGGITNERMLGFENQERLLKTSHDPVKQKLWEKIKGFNKSDPSVLSSSVDDHQSKVNKGDYAFFGDRSRIDIWTNKECDLRTIKENFFPVQYAVGLVKNSPYRILVSRAMIDMTDLGLFQTWSSRRWTKEEVCKDKLITEATAITVLDVQSAFYMLIVGIGLSTIILGAEKLATHYTTRCGRRRYSFDNAVLDKRAELTLNDSVEKTRDSYEIDLFSNISLASAACNVPGTDEEQTLSGDVYTLGKTIRGSPANEGNFMNTVLQFSCADSWDSGFDDQQQRKNPYVFKDKVPFYLSRISLPRSFCRNRSTSL